MSLGGSGGGQQVQRVEPSQLQAPFIADALQRSQDLYQQGPQQFFPDRTFALPSDETQQAQELARLAALGQQTTLAGSLFPAFQSALMSPTQRLADPALQGVLAANFRPMEDAASRLLQQARRDATRSGQLGGSRQEVLQSEIIKNLGQQQSDFANKFLGNIYGDALRSQAATLGLAPSIMSTFLAPSQTIASIGAQREAQTQKGIDEAVRRFAFEQEAPSNLLDQYFNRVGGNMFGSTTTTEGAESSGPGGLAGAAGAAGLASLIPGVSGTTLAGLGGAGSMFASGGSLSALGAINPYVAGAAILGGLLG